MQRRNVATTVTAAKNNMAKGPAIHPSCAILHASDSTPDPITPVIICAIAVHRFPSKFKYSILKKKKKKSPFKQKMNFNIEKNIILLIMKKNNSFY